MITITQKITPENHWLLFMAAESQRKSEDGEDEVIYVEGGIDFIEYQGQIYLPNNLAINNCLYFPKNIKSFKIPRSLRVFGNMCINSNNELLPDTLKVFGYIYVNYENVNKMKEDNPKFAKQIYSIYYGN